MGVQYNPKIVTNGLVTYLDAGNSNKSARGFKNLLNLSTWTLGTGSVTGFSQNGLTTENQRILDTGPFGVSALVWDTPSNDVASDGDGGWDGSAISIDNTKLYRFSVWMRRRVIGNGSYYLGCGSGVLNRVDGVLNNNPYFSASSWPASILADQWMLIVGHIWPAGSGTGTNHVDSGLWNTSGTKFSGPTYNGDFVWQTSSTSTILRSYLYYSTDTTTRQQWYQPRIDLVDGTEPTIAELISGVGSRWYDMIGTNHSSFVNSAAPYNTNGYIQFDGVDDYTTISIPSTTGSICFWYYFNAGTSASKLIMGNSSSMLYVGGAGTGAHWYNNTTDYSFYYDWGNTSQWFYICLVYDSLTSNKMYVNGNLAYSSTTYSLTKGSTYNVAGNYYNPQNCRFGNISVYNKALTNAEVSQNFDALRGRYGV